MNGFESQNTFTDGGRASKKYFHFVALSSVATSVFVYDILFFKVNFKNSTCLKSNCKNIT